jgi:lantibiotic biosynthesis protein
MYLLRSAGLPFSALSELQGDFMPLLETLTQAQTQLQTARNALLTAFDATLLALPEGDSRTQVYNARKHFFQKNGLKYREQWANVPTLAPTADAWLLAQTAVHEAEAAFAAAYERTTARALATLQNWAQYPDVQRALLFSSHALFGQIPAFVAAPVAEFGKKERHVAEGILRYTTRMATRTTPLTRWATVNWQAPDSTPAFTFPWENEAPETNRRYSADTVGDVDKIVKITPNAALLNAFYDVLLQYPVFRNALKVQLNPLLHLDESTDQYRWWYYNGTEEALQQTPTRPILRFLEEQWAANPQPVTLGAWVTTLAEATETTPERAEAYLLELLEMGFLEWILPENGLSPSWCGRLYQFLGFIEGGSSHPVITEAAFLLQWLRTAARTIPFQPVEEAAQTQREALQQVQLYFEKYLGVAPPIPVEQLFFEDVATTGNAPFFDENAAKNAIETLLAQRTYLELSTLRSRISHLLDERGPLRVLDIFAAVQTPAPTSNAPIVVPARPVEVPVGALLQPFSEGGSTGFVLNALFPGGGKVVGRWLHLFDAKATEAVKAQHRACPNLYALNWYHAFNANMHPPVAARSVQLPGVAATVGGIKVGDLRARRAADGHLELFNPTDQMPVFWADMGLEEATSRPLLVQILLLLGQPPLSKSQWVVHSPETIGTHVQYQPRQVVGSVVVQRASWRFEAGFWAEMLSLDAYSFFLAWQKMVRDYQLPLHLFVKMSGETSLYAGVNSPLHVALLQKTIRNNQPSWVVLEEMLPVPEERAWEVSLDILFTFGR